jgi:hypothetical protein
MGKDSVHLENFSPPADSRGAPGKPLEDASPDADKGGKSERLSPWHNRAPHDSINPCLKPSSRVYIRPWSPEPSAFGLAKAEALEGQAQCQTTRRRGIPTT